MLSSARFDHALFDYTLRYQRVPGGKYHVRPLSLLQQEVFYRCDGRVTVADLSDMTLAPILKFARPSPSSSRMAW